MVRSWNKPWEEQACDVCRQAILFGDLPHLASSFDRRRLLMRCKDCGDFWEQCGIYAMQIDRCEARTTYPAAFEVGEPPPTPSRHPRRFRFGLRTMFVLTTVVAVVLGACRAIPHFTLFLAIAFVYMLFVAFVVVVGVATTSHLAEAMLTAANQFARRLFQK